MNDCLLPVVERIFRKKYPHLEPKIVVKPLVETPQEQEEPAVLNYGEYKQAAQYKFAQEQAQTLEKVLSNLLNSDGVRLKNLDSIVQNFETQRELNPRVSKPVGHISSDFSAQDRAKLSDEDHYLASYSTE